MLALLLAALLLVTTPALAGGDAEICVNNTSNKGQIITPGGNRLLLIVYDKDGAFETHAMLTPSEKTELFFVSCRADETTTVCGHGATVVRYLGGR